MPPHVLIIDPDSERLEAIAALLEQEFDAVTHRYGTWRKFTKVRSKLPRMILAVLADGLVPPRPVDIQVYSLLDEGDPLVQNVVVLFDAVDGSLSGETDTRAHGVHVPTATAVDAVFRPACARVIPPPRLPIVTGPASRDPVLDYQIAALDLAAGDATRGETTLAKLIGRMWACPSAAVERLGQGYSGDLVLRVTTTDGTPSVLKVSRGASWTDRKHEADNWAAIEGALNEPYRHHVPELVRGPAGSALVEAGGFVALAFQFLGVAGTRFVDLERAYRDEAGCTAPARPAGTGPDGLAEFMVKAAVGLLRKAWYDHPQRRVTDSCLLWGDNEPSRAPVPGEPLYGLAPAARAELLLALEALAPFGARLLPGEWATAAQAVRDWVVAGGPPPGSPLRHPARVGVCPVHGDLNKANVLLWLDATPQVFLIDFATYRERGHALRDLAQVEAEVKFLLMDREAADTPLGLDYTAERLPVWIAAEDRLATWVADPAAGDPGPVRRAYDLIGWVRDQARQVHTNGGGDLPFETEYLVPLLYHTLRVVGYADVSPVKRVLAVRCAARITAAFSQPR